jgi:hypothetical protein
VASEVGGVLGGTVSVDEPFCGYAGCLRSAYVYEQDGSGSCASTPSGRLIYSVPDETGPGAGSWPYSFTPSVSAGSVQVCAYNILGGSLIASSSYVFPPPPSVAKPKLSVPAARTALRRALVRRFSNEKRLTLTCRSLSRVKVRCTASFNRSGYKYRGPATATLSGKVIHMTLALKRTSLPTALTTTPTQTTSAPTTPAKTTPTATVPTATATTPAATPVGCTPISDEGTCYEPGEYCRATDHGAIGIAGDGKTIECEDNDGWRWEPTD